MMGFPSPRYFKNMMRNTLIYNFLMMVDDVISSNKIYGPRIHYLKGETARRQPTQVVTDYISITTEVLKYHGDMTVAIDVIYTNKLASVVIIL